MAKRRPRSRQISNSATQKSLNAIASAEMRHALARMAAGARSMSVISRDRALFGAVLPFLVYRMPPIPAAMPSALFRRLDPWRTPGDEAKHEGARETSISLELLDGRPARLVRKIRSREARLIREIYLETDGGTRAWDLPVRLLPLYGIDAPSTNETVIVTEGVRAVENLRSRGLPAVGTLTGPLFLHSFAALEPLVGGRTVVVWPLPDTEGMAHMQQVAAQLARLRAHTIKMVYGRQNPTATLPARTTLKEILGWAANWQPALVGSLAQERLPRSGIRAALLGSRPGTSRSDERLVPTALVFRRTAALRHAMALRPYVAKIVSGDELDSAERDGFLRHLDGLLVALGNGPS